jgi:hypothetical protein
LESIVQINYFMFDWTIYRLFVLNRGWNCVSLQKCYIAHICLTWGSTWGMFELKTRFETWITSNDVNGVSLFHRSYLITLLAYLCSQRTPNVPIKYFMFDSSIYSLFVLNRGWKRDSLQIMIFVYICSTLGIGELKTRFDTWIT